MKDWVEDFHHENGKYANICIKCECQFMGHKRRFICKECVEPKEEESQEELREMIAKVHDHIEGRYELDSYDYGIIHALLCKLQ
jgi:hypothetical protein